MNKILIVSLITVLTIGGAFTGMYFSATNNEALLKVSIKAQQDACRTYYDKLWKVLQQKAGVADQYKSAFDTIYPKIMAGRYGNARGGALLSVITESNPSFDISLYKDLSQAIEAERAGFRREQDHLIDLKREHDNLLAVAPSKWFLNNKTDTVSIVLITSDKTEATYATGKENDIDLFNKK